jgi:hypothetical protein
VGRTQQTGCTSGMVETNRRASICPVLTAWLIGGVISNLQMKRPSDQQIANNPMRLLCSSSSGRNLGFNSGLQTRMTVVAVRVGLADVSGSESETRRLFKFILSHNLCRTLDIQLGTSTRTSKGTSGAFSTSVASGIARTYAVVDTGDGVRRGKAFFTLLTWISLQVSS